MLKATLFNQIFTFPILTLLIAVYSLFLALKIPGAFGFAIIILTVLIRLILQPFFHQQMQTAKKMQELKPHLDKLNEKHKGDKARLQQEQLKLYQQAGINPASGCLFLIIQIPIFIALYRALYSPFVAGGLANAVKEINRVLLWPALKVSTIDFWFFGFSLAVSPQNSGVWYYYSIPLLTAFLQYYQVQVSTPQVNKQEPQDEKKDSQADFQKVMSTQMKFIFPILIGWFSYTLPVGLSLYWNIFSVFSIIQYRNLTKNG